jgi:hypothetical protein
VKFKVATLRETYTPSQAKKLKELGFRFRPLVDSDDVDIRGNGEVSLHTIEDVVDFIAEYGEVIWNKNAITLYDGYNE